MAFPRRSKEALKKLKELKVKRVLDLGAGKCEQAKWIIENTDAHVTSVSLNEPPEWNHKRHKYIKGDVLKVLPMGKFDCVFASHVLEHQPNINNFMKLCVNELEVGGYLVITVPPIKHQIVGGHLSYWDAGMVLYHMVLAGLNCKNPMIKQYDYNITVIVKRDKVVPDLSNLYYDLGDIKKLSSYFPDGYNFDRCKGVIKELNWK